MNLVALTPCCVDYYPQLQKSFMGGNSLNVASMWKILSPYSNVSVITALGNDANGRMIFDFLSHKEIETTRVYMQDGSTACNQLRVDEHGERYGIEGTWNGGVYETFKLSEDDWEFVAKQDIIAIPANNPNFKEQLQRKHKKQIIAVDYLDIENCIPIEDSIDYTDIAFITAHQGVLKKYQELAYARNKLIVVTLGADGSYAFYKGAMYFQSALSVPKVVDTTGCGDAYQAAFALKYVQTNNIKESMNAGALAASKIAQAWGGVGFIEHSF